MKKMLKNTLILTMLLMSTISYSQSNPEVIDTTVNVPNNLTNVLDNYLTSFSTVDYHDEDYFIDNYNLNGDYIESQAFGFLAIRSFLNLPISFSTTTGCKEFTVGGKLVENF